MTLALPALSDDTSPSATRSEVGFGFSADPAHGQIDQGDRTVTIILGGILAISAVVWAVMLRGNRRERNRAARELRESKERFRDLAENVSDWMWEMGPDLRFTWLSSRVNEMLGMAPEFYIGK